MWPICGRLIMTASLRLREPFCLVTPTVGLIAWSLLPPQQFHIYCQSLCISSLVNWKKSITDILRGDIGSDRAAFATLSALSFPEIPTWPGIQQSTTILPEFLRVVYHVIRVEYECDSNRKCFFFRSSDNIQGKQDSVKFHIKDVCCTRQPYSWLTAFMAEDCRNSVAHFRTIGIDMIKTFKAITQLVKSYFKNLWRGDGLSEECGVRFISGHLRCHGGVAGRDNWDTVLQLKPIFSSSGAMPMPNVGSWLGFEEKEGFEFWTEDSVVSRNAQGWTESEGILYAKHSLQSVEWRFVGFEHTD